MPLFRCLHERSTDLGRAWSIVGLALRFAYLLGLHVRNEDASALVEKRETFVRTWWSLYSLERTLGIVTGRPSITVNTFCSVPLPLPVPGNGNTTGTTREHPTPYLGPGPEFRISTDESTLFLEDSTPKEPNSGSYFKAVVTLSIIVQDISSSLYSVATMIRPSKELQVEVTHLEQRLEEWAHLLPPQFNFQIRDIETDVRFIRERTTLRFQLCSAKMLLTRPYLSGRKQQYRGNEEANFSNRMGNICIEAAKSMVDFFPENSNGRVVYGQGPWWCIVHYMMQAVAVFLLGLSNPTCTSHKGAMMVQYARRTIRYLQSMEDPLALRASYIALETFDTVMRHRFWDNSAM
jgi:hypothetical protein